MYTNANATCDGRLLMPVYCKPPKEDEPEKPREPDQSGIGIKAVAAAAARYRTANLAELMRSGEAMTSQRD
jgi:hypothetical protein